LKATNTDIAIGKYTTGQTLISKEKKFQILWRYWKQPKNHNIATQNRHQKVFNGGFAFVRGLTL